MIKIDASNLIPKRLGTYLLGIIPGLVFELTIVYADPPFAHKALEQTRQIYPFQGYALLFIFLISCLIVGQTFFILA
jgi:16S rRNA G966 N2-methylase RsmD